MAITTITIDDIKKSVEISRDWREDFSCESMRQMRPINDDRGWIISQILKREIINLMSLSVDELRQKHLEIIAMEQANDR